MRVNCRCGAVGLQLPGTSPRLCVADGCSSCRFVLSCGKSHGARLVSPSGNGDKVEGHREQQESSEKALITQFYYSDDILVEKGESFLRVVALSPTPPRTLRLVTDCCGSVVLGWHPLYEGRLVSVPLDGCVASGYGAAKTGVEGADGLIGLSAPGNVYDGARAIAEDVVREWGGDPDYVVYGDEPLEEIVKGFVRLLGLAGKATPGEERKGRKFEEIVSSLERGVEMLHDVFPQNGFGDSAIRRKEGGSASTHLQDS